MDGPLGCGRATVDTVAVAVAVAVTGRYSGWMGYKSKCDNGQRHREVYITLPIKRSDTNVSLVSFMCMCACVCVAHFVAQTICLLNLNINLQQINSESIYRMHSE